MPKTKPSKAAAPELLIEWLPPGQLTPYSRNPRVGGAIEKVAASIRAFGWRQPIVVDDKLVVICGHTRLAAAHLLEAPRVPVHVARGLSPAKVKALRIADNRVAEDAEWDFERLGLELADLSALDFDLSVLGLDLAELEIAGGGVAGGPAAARAKLAERFGAPPFSILDARMGYWQARKDAWLALGIRGELGRAGDEVFEDAPAAAPTASRRRRARDTAAAAP